MNRLPDMIVLDFCIWLNEKISSSNSNRASLIDALSSDRLSSYAETFLSEYRYKSNPLRSLVIGFLESEEFHFLESGPDPFEYWEHLPGRLRKQYESHVMRQSKNDRRRFALEESFHYYLLRCSEQYSREGYNISPYDLAKNTLDYFYNRSNSPNNTSYDSGFMAFMMNTRNEVAVEINFMEWILEQKTSMSFETMPSEVFEQMLEKYAHETGISSEETMRIKNDYYNTGWATVFRRIQRWFSLNGKRPQRSLAYVMDRYLSKRARYNCIILPLADKESKKQFRDIINDEWKNLNSLSGDTLDIYYSETEIGETGYDIAMKLRYLPNRLRKTAPSIILWKDSIEEAKAIPTGRLNAKQIYEVFETIVQQIEADKEIDTIIQEACNTVKKQHELNHGVTNYNIHGDGNVVGDQNNVKTTVVKGTGNTVISNDISQKNSQFDQQIDNAIKAITKSDEIKEKTKEQLVAVMEEARQAEREQSEEKRASARTKFDVIKEILTDVAPKLITSLLDLTKIAAFFGLGV